MQALGGIRDRTFAPSAACRPIARLWELTRAREWWDYKLVPAIAVLYATALLDNADFETVVWALVHLIFALAVGAGFVGALNDLTDRNDDRRAGKPDRIGPDSRKSWLVVASAAVAGGILLLSFSDRPILFWTYAAGWIAFSAYSLPPLRLKCRAMPGLICDAVGAHFVPAVLAVALIRPGQEWDPWLVAVAAWSFAYGLRGILGHQLADEAADRAAQIDTFVARHGAVTTRRILRLAVFPLELAALSAMLALIGSVTVWFGLAASLAFFWGKLKQYRLEGVLAVSSDRQAIILADFYLAFLPFSLLVALATGDAWFVLLIAAQPIVFPAYFLVNLRELSGLFARNEA